MPQEKQTNPIDELRAQVSRFLDTLDPAAPIGATVVFPVKAAKESVFATNAQVLAEATRKLPGCDVFAYQKRWGPEYADPVEYLIYENWQKVQQFRAQWDSEHLKKFQYGVLDLVAGFPDLRWYHGWSVTGTGAIETGARVPQTGQKGCWNTSGQPVDCAGTGQDGAVQAGMPHPSPRFTDNGDGTVMDKLTGLTWLKDADRFGEVTWEEALAHARTLASGSDGLTDNSKAGDWRLPNIKELFSMIDYGTGAPIIPKDHPFENVKASIYWTNTTLAAAPTLAWMMTLGIGPTVFDLKINPNRMWPVRGNSQVPQTGQVKCWDQHGNPIENCQGTRQDGDIRAGLAWPQPRFTDNGDGTVTDSLTSLVWLKHANPFGMRTWKEALSDCNSVSSGSHGLTDGSKPGEWRLPNIKEIESLVDYNETGPCLPDRGQPFTDVRPSSYWTSTTVAAAPTQAMFIILGVGPAIFENKEHPFFVWPVRDGSPAK